MKTRRIVHSALALAAVLSLTACGHKPTVVAPKPTIVGTWNGTIVLPGGAGTVAATLTLRTDNTFNKQGGSQADYSGTYSVTGNTLTETFKSYTVDGKTMSIPADAPNVEMDTFVLAGDTLTITPPDKGPPTVLKRAPPMP